MASLRRWSVVFLVLALFLLYNREIPLTQDERSYLTASYQSTHDVYQIQARYYSRDQIKVSMLARPRQGGPAERINLIYDRQHPAIVSAQIEAYGTPLVEWLGQFALAFTLLASWLLYLDPLLAGRYCPNCRIAGVFPRILRVKERTLYPSVLSEDGGCTPEIIEQERACPSCAYREYRIREHSVSVQGDLLAELKGSLNVHRSDERIDQDIRALEERARSQGVSRGLHRQRLEQAIADAEAKTTPRP